MAPDLQFTAEVIDRIADHIAEFSLAGIQAVSQHMQEVKP